MLVNRVSVNRLKEKALAAAERGRPLYGKVARRSWAIDCWAEKRRSNLPRTSKGMARTPPGLAAQVESPGGIVHHHSIVALARTQSRVAQNQQP